jgi:ribosomal protein L7/L12
VTTPVEQPATTRQPSLAQPVQTTPAIGSGYEVILTQIGPNKDNVFNAIRSLTGCGLAEAKIIFETPRSRVLEGCLKRKPRLPRRGWRPKGPESKPARCQSCPESPGPTGNLHAYAQGLRPNKISVIKIVRALTSLNLLEAKTLVENFPTTLLNGLPAYAARWPGPTWNRSARPSNSSRRQPVWRLLPSIRHRSPSS